MSGYRTIVADPPWTMPSGGPRGGPESRWQSAKSHPYELPYQSMTLDAIAALPVADLAERDAHLYLWIPNALLEHGWDVCRSWGFAPSTVLVWCKTPRGLGLGGAFTKTAEYLIFARRGSLPALRRVDSTWFHWKRPHNNHSAKPEAALDLIESVSPGPYLELFARRNRLGWDTWGNEAHEHVRIEQLSEAPSHTSHDPRALAQAAPSGVGQAQPLAGIVTSRDGAGIVGSTTERQ